MDPDKALQDAREALQDYRDAEQRWSELGMANAAEGLAGAFQALDEWLSRGGFLPRDWRPSVAMVSEQCDHARGWWPCGADPAHCTDGNK